MWHKFLKIFRCVEIDVHVYIMVKYQPFNNAVFTHEIFEDSIKTTVKRYYIKNNHALIHESFLFSRVFLLRVINKKGPVIGNCYTSSSFRGQSIYPSVLNHIAKECLIYNKSKEVFVIVNTNNLPSIKGIEKAGFKRYASIYCKRWLFWYFHKNIKYSI